MKSLKDISWQVTEDEYRADPALSYSTLARYERSGFNGLKSLFDKIESPSLLFGSCVDAIITGGMDEFNSRFIVMDIPDVEPAVKQVLETIFYSGVDQKLELCAIPDSTIIACTESTGYQPRWKPETRAKVIREKGTEYYKALKSQGDKILVTQSMYEDVLNSVKALKEGKVTSFFFGESNPFEGEIERLYQLKFKATFDGVDYRCMFDELVVDHEKKTIIPVDLKTSHKPEWDFYKSFVEWNYQIQCRLYARILKEVISKDEYFRDFTIYDYKDIVVNKETLTPLVWTIDFTHKEGTLTFGNVTFRDPLEIGKELNNYLTTSPLVPIGIQADGINEISKYLNTL